MAKEEKKEPDALLAVAMRKREGRFEVFTVSRKAGKQEERVIKSTDDKRIAADRLLTTAMEVRW